MSFLSDVADVLQAPKNYLWSVMPGLHDEQGNPYTGAQVAQHAFGTDPDSFWGRALGFGLDVAGDPLNLLFPFAARGVGAAAKGLGLLGEGAEAAGAAAGATSPLADALGAAAPEAAEAAMPAAAGAWAPAATAAPDAASTWGKTLGLGEKALDLSTPLSPEAATQMYLEAGLPTSHAMLHPNFEKLAANWGEYALDPKAITAQDVLDKLRIVTEPFDSEAGARALLSKAGYGRAALPTDVLPSTLPAAAAGRAAGGPGPFLASLGGGAEAAAGTGAGGNYAILKPLREKFGIMKGVGRIAPEDAIAAATGPLPERAIAEEALRRNALMRPDQGAYYPAHDFGLAGSPTAARHEIVHGLIDQAAKSGQLGGLPLALRVPATLEQFQNPFVRGVGGILNEAAAQGLQNRGFLPQAQGYLNYLLNPAFPNRAGYAAQVAQRSPLAAGLYQALPYGVAGTAAAGAGAAAYPYFRGP
jgi:hypothetical protein